MKEEIRNEIVKETLKLIGKKYVHGDNGPKTFDCAGLVWYVYNKVLGINIYKDGYGKSTTGRIMTNPMGKLTIIKEGYKNMDLSLLKPGDILFFHRQSKYETETKPENKYPGHCGIYVGNGKFVHATRRRYDVEKEVGKEEYEIIIKQNNAKKPGLVLTSKLSSKKYWTSKIVGIKNIID